jgi:hypothetical protein
VADSAVARYAKHADFFGCDLVLETAEEDGLPPIELARLAKELGRLPRERPGNQYRREPHGTWFYGPAFKLTQAEREHLIRRLLAAGYDPEFTARQTGATVAYVRRLRRA